MPECAAGRALRRALAGALLTLAAGSAHAEPYLAVQSGLRCAQCHVNQTGGGLRTALGHRFAQARLAMPAEPSGEPWLGQLGDHIGIGADVRASASRSRTPNGERASEPLDLREARLYLNLSPWPDRLSLYLDQFIRPSPSINRELFVLYRAADASHYLKAGRFYLPFGWRLQDGTALVREQTAIDMNGPDRGVEAGWDRGPLSLQLAVSNGTFGGPEVDDGKQYSMQAAWIESRWRVGLAGNLNDRAIGRRRLLGLFGGWHTAPLSWLAELAFIDDRSARSSAWLLEANWQVAQGHNLKATAEGARARNAAPGTLQRTRLSLVYEATPRAWVQLRAGVRGSGGDVAPGASRPQLGFVELHGFF